MPAFQQELPFLKRATTRASEFLFFFLFPIFNYVCLHHTQNDLFAPTSPRATIEGVSMGITAPERVLAAVQEVKINPSLIVCIFNTTPVHFFFNHYNTSLMRKSDYAPLPF